MRIKEGKNMKITPFEKVFVNSSFESKKTPGLWYVDGISFSDGIPQRCSFRASHLFQYATELDNPEFDLRAGNNAGTITYYLVLL